MRQYYVILRLYRSQDQNYWSMHVRLSADSLSGLEAQIRAYEVGAQLAGAQQITLDNIGVDAPLAVAKSFVPLDDPEMQVEIMYFLGQKRDRRHKGPPRTEQEIAEGYGDAIVTDQEAG